MQKTKIQLLPMEMEMMCNTEFILTKNALLQKLKYFLEDLQESQQNLIDKNAAVFPPEVLKIPAKVSRGENYLGLPWLMLDYPRYFEHQNIFAIRTMFWWGNFFSATLHLSGKYKEMFQTKIIEQYLLWQLNEYFLCVEDKEWEHHFEPSNYIKTTGLTREEFTETIRNKPFLKIAKKFSLTEFDKMKRNLCNSFEEMISLLN